MSHAKPTTGPSERSASFREVMASREYRAVFSASALSWFGDYAARAAVTALVYAKTHSVAASAATFAISYLPWLGFGAVLSAVAERYSYRKVMVICDVSRLAIMALIALIMGPVPVPVLTVLLFVTALLNPPFDAARSALLPQILDGDRYVVGLGMQRTVGQVAMITGYVGGAALTGYDTRIALLINAATFGFSAVAIWFGVRERPPSLRVEERSNLMRESADGYTVVFRSPVLRGIAIIVFAGAAFGIVPEGLAAAWAAELTESSAQRGWFQGVIMMSGAAGFIIGSLVVSRLFSPQTRTRLIRPFAMLTPLTLVPALIKPSFPVVVAITVASGITLAGMLPASNGLFVQALPPAFRARAFGVIQSGLYLIQGAAVTVAGALASRFELYQVVGLWGVGGVVAMVLISVTWPSKATINDAIIANRIRIAAEEHAETAAPGHEFGEDTIDLGRPSSPLRRSRPAPSQAGLGPNATDGPTVPIKPYVGEGAAPFAPLVGEGPTVPLKPSASEAQTVPLKPGIPPPPPGFNTASGAPGVAGASNGPGFAGGANNSPGFTGGASGPGFAGGNGPGHATKPASPSSRPGGRHATRGDHLA